MTSLCNEPYSAICGISNTLSLIIVVEDSGEEVKYQYSDKDEVFTAPIKYDKTEPYFETKWGVMYYLNEFVRRCH